MLRGSDFDCSYVKTVKSSVVSRHYFELYLNLCNDCMVRPFLVRLIKVLVNILWLDGMVVRVSGLVIGGS